MEIIAANSLIALANHFKGSQVLSRPQPKVREPEGSLTDLKDIKGQESAKRALEVAAAGQRRHAGGMMGSAERALVGERAAVDLAGDRGDHGDFEKLGRRQRRQDGGQPRGEHRLAGSGRPDHLWPPAAATSSARLALSWPLMSARSSSVSATSRIFGCGRDSTCVPLK